MTRKRKIEHSVVRPFGLQGAVAIRAAEAKKEPLPVLPDKGECYSHALDRAMVHPSLRKEGC